MYKKKKCKDINCKTDHTKTYTPPLGEFCGVVGSSPTEFMNPIHNGHQSIPTSSSSLTTQSTLPSVVAHYQSVATADHNNNDDNNGSLFQTKAGAVGELIQTWIGVYFLLAPSIDNALDLKSASPLGSLPVSIIIGLLAALVASSTAYCHYVVNSKHEDTDSSDQPEATNEDEHPWLDLYNLLLDGLGHAAEFTGFSNGVLSMTASGYLNRWQMFALNALMFGVGLIMAKADMRTCKHHMHHGAAPQIAAICDVEAQQTEQTLTLSTNMPDFWTGMGIIGFLSRTAFIEVIFIGGIIDHLLGLDSNTALGISATSAYLSIPFALAITMGSTYCDGVLNLNNQEHYEKEKNSTDRPITWLQWLALRTSNIALSTNFAASVLLLIDVCKPNSIQSLPAALGFSAGLTAVGCYVTKANVDTYQDNLQIRNEVLDIQQTLRSSLLERPL